MAVRIFDPLVFLAPFVLTVTQILQDLSRIKLVWDDEIPPVYGLRWENWLLDLPKLSSFAFNRCLKTADFGQVKSSQLIIFLISRRWPTVPWLICAWSVTKGRYTVRFSFNWKVTPCTSESCLYSALGALCCYSLCLSRQDAQERD